MAPSFDWPDAGEVGMASSPGPVQFNPKQDFQVDSFFDITFDISVSSAALGVDTNVESFEVISDAPIGFSDVAPSGCGLVDLSVGPLLDSFFDITYQVQGVAIDHLGNRRTIQWQGTQMNRLPDGSGFRVNLSQGWGRHFSRLDRAGQ